MLITNAFNKEEWELLFENHPLFFFLQVIYFQACEIVLLSGHQKATYLYTLMFYNVVSYCLNYVKEVYERKAWTPYVTITETSQVRHLGISATKLTLEWTKVKYFKETESLAAPFGAVSLIPDSSAGDFK